MFWGEVPVVRLVRCDRPFVTLVVPPIATVVATFVVATAVALVVTALVVVGVALLIWAQ